MDTCLEITTHWRGALLSLKHFQNPKSLKIGRGNTADLVVEHEDATLQPFEFVRKNDKGIVVRNAPWMSMKHNGSAVKNDSVELGAKDVVKILVGDIELNLRQVVSNKPITTSFIENFDYRYGLLLLFLLSVQTGLLFQIENMPVKAREPDLMKTPEVFREVLVKIQKKEKKRIVEASSAGGAAAGPEGLIGEKDKPPVDKIAGKQSNKLATEDTPNRSQNAALNMLKKLGLRNAGSVIGEGGLGAGANKGLLGLRGTEVGIAGGHGGLGTKGTGSGGGGKALGAGGLGSGSGLGFGGTGDVDLGGKGKGRTRIIPGDIFYEGGLTREEIQRVVDRFMSQIKYCYEREIQSQPELEGKLTANWVIAPDGRVRVSTLGESTLSNSNVEQCVLKVVNRMIFPEPRGGGIVKVNFPFVFSTAGV